MSTGTLRLAKAREVQTTKMVVDTYDVACIDFTARYCIVEVLTERKPEAILVNGVMWKGAALLSYSRNMKPVYGPGYYHYPADFVQEGPWQVDIRLPHAVVKLDAHKLIFTKGTIPTIGATLVETVDSIPAAEPTPAPKLNPTKTVRVTITGPTNSGKSRAAVLIRRALSKAGFAVGSLNVATEMAPADLLHLEESAIPCHGLEAIVEEKPSLSKDAEAKVEAKKCGGIGPFQWENYGKRCPFWDSHSDGCTTCPRFTGGRGA